MQKKIWKTFLELEIIAFEFVALNTRFYCQRILLIGTQYLSKQCQDLKYYQKRNLAADFLSERSKNMMKILGCRFKQCLGPLNMLTIHKCSDTWLFRNLSNPAFSIL